MADFVPINKVDTSVEILARIIKSVSRKYDCSMKIDFSNGNRITEFVGDEASKQCIIEEVQGILEKKNREEK